MSRHRPCLPLLSLLIVAVAVIVTSTSYAAAPPQSPQTTTAKKAHPTDVYSAFDMLRSRGEAIEIKGLADTTLTIGWDGFEPVFSFGGVAIENLVVTHDRTGISVSRLPDLSGGFHAEFSINSSGGLVVQVSSFIDTNGVQFLVDVIDGTVAETATCMCFGTTAGGTACTNTQCDEGESCLSDAGGVALKHCRWTAAQETSPARPISVVIIQFE